MFVYVVGSSFREFASRYESVYTKGQIISEMPSLNGNFFDVAFLQGIDTNDQNDILGYMQNCGAKFSCVQKVVEPIQLSQMRKEQILLSEPVVEKGNKFKFNLVVNNKNPIILDHMTGDHLPGILIFDAINQAVSFINKKAKVLSISCKYHSFLFPFPVKVVCCI